MDIIIVDDEPVSLALLRELVAKLPGCRGRGFTHAAAALAWCESNEPELAIVDYVMPEVDGLEFTRQLRAMPGRESTPIIMVTIRGEREVLNRALEARINDFLIKPFDLVQLQSCVSNILGLRAIQKQLANRALLMDAEAAAANKPASGDYRSSRLIDMMMTRARLGGDDSLLQDVSRIFIDTVPRVVSSIRCALTDRDLARVLAQVSSLKGAVAAFDAPDVFDFLGKVEVHARKNDVASTVAAFAMAQSLVERLLSELTSNALTQPTPRAAST